MLTPLMKWSTTAFRTASSSPVSLAITPRKTRTGGLFSTFALWTIKHKIPTRAAAALVVAVEVVVAVVVVVVVVVELVVEVVQLVVVVVVVIVVVVVVV
ncbi:LOW QUALITY PROTEIN: hypothetical protein ElyMa_006937100 [Elysia marginata]|uniref:Uncharacterized protein n=1 Tax=Elysia marginata TaxID=1093978 RepID=A0AAV4JI20_9GAST|nr:LOW QUALITY PROTEIN: hypothetical protein ElyMa_006937100 [Elysia marginata]